MVDRPALQAGIRAAVAVSAGFAVGRYVLDDIQFAIFAAFTAMAILVFADYGGPLRMRVAAIGCTVAAALGLVALGTAASLSAWGGPLAVGVVGFVVAYAAVLGGYFVAGANAVILFAALAAGIPAPDDAIGPRLAGTAAGGALALAVTVIMWPERPGADARPAIGRAAAACCACLTATDPAASAAAATADVRGARADLGDLRHRPAEPTARHRAMLRLVFDLDRLLGRIVALTARPLALPPEARRLLDLGGVGLAAAAESLADRRPQHDPAELEARLRGLLPEVRTSLAARAVTADPVVVAAEVEEAAIGGEIATAATRTAFDSEVAGGRRPRGAGPAAAALLDVSPARVAARRLRGNLTVRSVHFRGAVRLAAALALAMALVRVLDLQHGFWVVLATLTVVRSTAAATSVTARQAVLGTAVGFALSVILILGAADDSHLYVILLGAVICGAVYAARVGGVVVGQAAFTVLFVVLFSLLAPAGWTLALVRVEDVVAGALVGVAIGLVAWPHGAGAQLPAAAAELIERAADEVRTAARRALGGERDADAAARRAATLRAARSAEDHIAVALAEQRPRGMGPEAWPALLAEAEGVWYSTWWLADVPEGPPAPAPCDPLVRELLRRADAAADALDAAAAALRAGGSAPPPLGPPDDAGLVTACAGSAGVERGEALVRLLVVRHWVREVEAVAGRMQDRIAAVEVRPREGVIARLRLSAHAGGDLGR